MSSRTLTAMKTPRTPRGQVQLAGLLELNPSTLSRLADGYTPDTTAFTSMVTGLNIPAERFITAEELSEREEPDHATSLAPLLRARKDPKPEDADHPYKSSLAGTDYVYMWVDGIHLKVRLQQDKVCLLVMIGVRADDTKELIALDDGHRESTESWPTYSARPSAAGCGHRLSPPATALGFWAAVREVFPETREQRCWFHKIANVLAALPKSVQGDAKAALAEIWNAEDRDHAAAAAAAFEATYGIKWPKATAKITGDLDVLLAFYDYPAEH